MTPILKAAGMSCLSSPSEVPRRKGDQGVLWSVEGECHLGQGLKGFVQTSWLEDGGTASPPQEPLKYEI